jgi:signal transduction histidine kinase
MSESTQSLLSQHYAEALRAHLEQGGKASLAAAQELGDQAVTLGMETLDLARVHDQALSALRLPETSPVIRAEMAARSELFFAEAAAPIEMTHRIAQESYEALNRVNQALSQRTLDLADSHRELQQGIMERKTAAAALDTSQQVSFHLLQESKLLEQHLQQMAHEILNANEAERKKMSHHLHDEIAQTLLGIHVKLLTLKKDAAARHASLTLEIALTQELVEASVVTINKFAHEIGLPGTRPAH